MEDVDADGRTRRRREGQGDPKKKYMDVLQGVADRTISEVLIELDDLEKVFYSTRSLQRRADEYTD